MLTSSQQREILEAIRHICDAETFRRACRELMVKLECDYYLFSMFKSVGVSHKRLFLDSNFPCDWLARNLQDDRKQTDPVIIHCMNHYVPVAWSSLYESADQQGKQELAEARKVGLVDGVSVPIHGRLGEFGILSLAVREPLTVENRFKLMVQTPLFAPYLQEAANAFKIKEEPTYQLTSREKECLGWASEGKTTWEISQILAISESTVNFHLNNTIKKTQAVNRQQAIVKALMSGTLLPGQYMVD